jgi:hypothetical protein
MEDAAAERVMAKVQIILFARLLYLDVMKSPRTGFPTVSRRLVLASVAGTRTAT